MEEDKLLRFHERLKDFLQKHLQLFLNIVFIFVILILLSAGWIYYQRSKEKKAYQTFLELVHKRASVKELNEFVKKYGSTQAGLQATLLLWENALNFNDMKGLENYLPYLKKIYPRELKDNLYYAEAKVYEEKGNFGEAKRTYEKIKKGPLRKLVLLDLARLSSKSHPKEALKYLEEVSKTLEEGYFKSWAIYKMEALRGL